MRISNTINLVPIFAKCQDFQGSDASIEARWHAEDHAENGRTVIMTESPKQAWIGIQGDTDRTDHVTSWLSGATVGDRYRLIEPVPSSLRDPKRGAPYWPVQETRRRIQPVRQHKSVTKEWEKAAGHDRLLAARREAREGKTVLLPLNPDKSMVVGSRQQIGRQVRQMLNFKNFLVLRPTHPSSKNPQNFIYRTTPYHVQSIQTWPKPLRTKNKFYKTGS
ncbi:MAG: hypothetical protein KTR14_01860 [Vampirovibrio sp.]|nr:hypothetical protein [Vampirovibrio sp.]